MRTKKKTVITSLVALSIIAGGAALAQAGPRPKHVDRFKVSDDVKQSFEKLANEPPHELPAPTIQMVGDTMEQLGRLEAVSDGRALISIPLDPGGEADHVFAHPVSSAAEVGDNTIYQGRLYVMYPVAPEGPSNLDQLLGRDVSLDLRRDDHDVARITFLRVK